MRNPRALPLSVLAALGLLLCWFASEPNGAGAAPPTVAAIDAAQPAPPSSAPVMDAGVAQEEEQKDTATIVFVTVPNATATVTWGRKLLGRIRPGKPLVVVRPHDSGPLDVMVRASGYLPVQTRAHTFSDARVLVRLTKPEQKNELLGYRIPLDAGVGEGGVDEAGAPLAADAGASKAWEGGFGPLMPVTPLAP